MGRELPTWSQAQLILSHGPLSVGIFPSSRPWMPRHKDRRFRAVGPGVVDPEVTPYGGSALLPLLESTRTSLDEQGVGIIAGEAEGHRLLKLHGGGEGWTLVVAVDAWVAVGPRASWPEVVQIGPHMLESHGAIMRRPDPEPNDATSPVVEFHIKDSDAPA